MQPRDATLAGRLQKLVRGGTLGADRECCIVWRSATEVDEATGRRRGVLEVPDDGAGGKPVRLRAHEAAWRAFRGELPGDPIRWTCEATSGGLCVNPWHLYAGGRADEAASTLSSMPLIMVYDPQQAVGKRGATQQQQHVFELIPRPPNKRGPGRPRKNPMFVALTPSLAVPAPVAADAPLRCPKAIKFSTYNVDKLREFVSAREVVSRFGNDDPNGNATTTAAVKQPRNWFDRLPDAKRSRTATAPVEIELETEAEEEAPPPEWDPLACAFGDDAYPVEWFDPPPDV